MRERLERALGLGEGEGAKAARLVSLIFLISVSLVLLKSAQNSIFLMAYPRTMIPYAFIASAAALTVASLVLVPLARRLGTARLALWAHGACAVAMFALRGLTATKLVATPFVTYVVIEASSGVLLIQAWATVSQATHARSAKRLLPVAGVGATVAWAVFGLLVPRLAHTLGTTNLLVVGGATLVLATLVVQAIRTRDLPDVAPQTKRVEVVREWGKAFAFIRSLPLLRVMTALSIIALLTEQLMDYLLMSAAHERYTTDAACTAFFGQYYGITSLVTLVFVLGASSRILLGLGTSRTLLLTPVLTVVVAVAAVVSPSFLAVVALRGVDRVMKQSIWSSASEQTQTPIPAVERVQSRALVRGVLAPVAYASAACVLAALPKIAEVRWLALGTALGVAVMAWLCVVRVRPAYQDALRRAIDERTLDIDEESPISFDADARRTLAQELSSTDERRAMLAAELLCDVDPTPNVEVVHTAMRSKLAAVRVAVLESVIRRRVTGLDDLLAHVLVRDSDEECRAMAARAIVTLGADSTAVREAISTAIASDSSAIVKSGARVASAGLRDRSGIRDGSALVAMVESGDDPLATAALQALDVKAAANDDVVRSIRRVLLSNAAHATKLAAIDASARLGLEELLPSIAALLESPEIGPDVATRLVAWGGDALAYVERGVASASAESVRYVASALTGAPGATSPLLVRLLSHADPEVRDRAVRTLSYAVSTQKLPLPAEVDISPLLERELALAYRMTIILAGIAQDDGTPDWKIDPPYDRLGHEIELEVLSTRERILHLLTLVGNHELARAVEVGLRRSSADVDAKIAELVDVSLPRALSKKVVPLFERMSLRERAEAAGRAPELGDPLAAIIDLGDPVVRGFAMLAYGERFRQRFPAVHESESDMIPLFERMAFLRTVPLFEEMPGHELRAVAEMLSVVEITKDETLFRKGDPGHDLFIVKKGSVSLRDGIVELSVAKEQDFFGELALLDNEPRAASAVTLEQTSLLRLRSADFRELMARRPQIQERVLKVVVRRLRDARRAATP
jgi:Cyclic nucleotide-binding domain